MKTMKEMKGIIVPILTPMNEDESINFEALTIQVDRMINNGIHGIFCAGTNGEGYILTDDEKIAVLETVVQRVNGRVPVYAGTGCISTKATIQLSQKAKAISADFLSVITPWFAAASQAELAEHYTAIAQAVELPMVLYNIPARTGNALAPATVEKLAHIENIVGVKDSSGNFDNMLQYIECTRDIPGFSVLSGNDSLILWNLLAGGKGAISGCANVFPRNMASIYDLFMAGDLAAARNAQDAVRGLRNTFRFGNPNTIVKTAVSLQGYHVGRCRKPFDSVSPEGIQAIRDALADAAGKGVC
jgi:4-hydroxy-tetrahydrodipicolinate synthase